MYHLLPGRQIITGVAVGVAFAAAYLAYFFDPLNSSLTPIKYISLAVGIADIIVVVVSAVLWRWLWRKLPILSEVIFPDLNGVWEGQIKFGSEANQAGLDAKARIKQNLWAIHIDLYSTTSTSHTLIAYPTVEAGNPLIYYVYHNVPKNPNYPEYKGTSVLAPRRENSRMQLSGHYYTVRGTRGTIDLKRVSDNPNEAG